MAGGPIVSRSILCLYIISEKNGASNHLGVFEDISEHQQICFLRPGRANKKLIKNFVSHLFFGLQKKTLGSQERKTTTMYPSGSSTCGFFFILRSKSWVVHFVGFSFLVSVLGFPFLGLAFWFKC